MIKELLHLLLLPGLLSLTFDIKISLEDLPEADHFADGPFPVCLSGGHIFRQAAMFFYNNSGPNAVLCAKDDFVVTKPQR